MDYHQDDGAFSLPALPPMAEADHAIDWFMDEASEGPYVGSPMAKASGTVTTATTNDSIYGGSRKSSGLERKLGMTELSKSDEERLKEVFFRNHHLMPNRPRIFALLWPRLGLPVNVPDLTFTLPPLQ